LIQHLWCKTYAPAMNNMHLIRFHTFTFASLTSLTICANPPTLQYSAGTAIVRLTNGIEYTLFKDVTESSTQFIGGKDTKVRTTIKSAILSEVKNVASVKTTSTSSVPFQGCCGSNVTAYDLRSKGRLASLTDWFSEKDVLRALAQDSWLNKNVKQPESLDQISKNGTNNPFVCRSALDHNFAFHHLNGDSVAVRLYLPDECFGESVQLGFYLPIPDSLKSAFATANAQKKLIKQK